MPMMPQQHRPTLTTLKSKLQTVSTHRPSKQTYGSGRGGRPWRRKRERIALRDGYLCQQHLRGGIELVVDLPDGICDHVLCLAEGGSDDEGNLEWQCKECSDKKMREESRRGAAR